jgi:hypothetical protein
MCCSVATLLLPTKLYALHCTLATPKNATHYYPLVNSLATPILSFRYRYICCCREGPLVVPTQDGVTRRLQILHKSSTLIVENHILLGTSCWRTHHYKAGCQTSNPCNVVLWKKFTSTESKT